MTTSRRLVDYYEPDELVYKNNTPRMIPLKTSSHRDSVVTTKSRDGTYNVVEKDFGDHKVIYHIPMEYGDDYDVSQLEDISIVEEPSARSSPKLVRRRIVEQYADYDNDYEYVEEVPVGSSRRRNYPSPRRQSETQVIERIYEPIPPPPQTVEYIYEDDYGDQYSHRPDNIEEVEYVVRERAPREVYVEEPRPSRRMIYVEEPSVPAPPSPKFLPPPPPPPPPASYSPRRSPPHQQSPRPIAYTRSPSPIPPRSFRRTNVTPPPPPASSRKQKTPRSPIYEQPIKPNIPRPTEPPLRLMDVIAQNRARRGPNIPKPRREIDEAKVYDPPTYKRNIIKNGFIIHK